MQTSNTKHFARYTNKRIRTALRRASEALLAPRIGRSTFSVELFLASLHLVFGKVLIRQFDDSKAFLRMREELIPDYKLGLYQRIVKRSQLPGVMTRYDDQLRDLLWNAIRIARASGRRSAGLPEVMAALCLDDDLVNYLKQKRGFSPVKFLEQFPRKPKQPSSG